MEDLFQGLDKLLADIAQNLLLVSLGLEGLSKPYLLLLLTVAHHLGRLSLARDKQVSM